MIHPISPITRTCYPNAVTCQHTWSSIDPTKAKPVSKTWVVVPKFHCCKCGSTRYSDGTIRPQRKEAKNG